MHFIRHNVPKNKVLIIPKSILISTPADYPRLKSADLRLSTAPHTPLAHSDTPPPPGSASPLSADTPSPSPRTDTDHSP